MDPSGHFWGWYTKTVWGKALQGAVAILHFSATEKNVGETAVTSDDVKWTALPQFWALAYPLSWYHPPYYPA